MYQFGSLFSLIVHPIMTFILNPQSGKINEQFYMSRPIYRLFSDAAT